MTADPTGKEGRWAPDSECGYQNRTQTSTISMRETLSSQERISRKASDPYEFRDPYLWRARTGHTEFACCRDDRIREDGTQLTCTAVMTDCTGEKANPLSKTSRRIGVMWECPNFFRWEAVHSDRKSWWTWQAEEGEVGSIRFPKGNNVCYIRGRFNGQTEVFTPDSDDSRRRLPTMSLLTAAWTSTHRRCLRLQTADAL